MRSVVGTIFSALLLLVASGAYAEPKYEPGVIPKCKVELCGDHRACTYDLGQVKLMYKADSELVLLRKEVPLLKDKVYLLRKSVENMTEASELQRNSKDTLSKRLSELTRQLIESDRKLQTEISKPKWGSYIAWGVAVVVTASFAGYIAADQLSK